MTRYLIFLLSFALITPIAFGDEDKDRDQLKTNELPAYGELRDPFWPIGYTRRVEPKVDPNEQQKKSETPVKIEPEWPKLKLKAVTSSPNGFIAIIEGIGLVEKGRIIHKTIDGIVYRWRIGEISQKGFSYTKIDAKPAKK